MGRPLNKKYFGDPSETGSQFRLIEAWIPGEDSPTAAAYIVSQKGKSRFRVSDGSAEGIVTLVEGGSDAIEEGQARLEVAVYDGGTEYARAIYSHRVKTFEGNNHVWSTSAATRSGQADFSFE